MAQLPPDAMPPPDEGAPDAMQQQGDGNDSFDQAVTITVGSAGAMEGIRSPGDHDFYKFTGTAGQWIRVATDANPMDDPNKLDTVITMYGPDSTTTQVAENDDAIPRINTDSEIIIRLPAAGTYYLEVQDYTDWSGVGVPEFGPTYDYTITVMELTPALSGVMLEAATDPGNDVASATPIAMTQGVLLSKFDAADDVDVYSVDIAAPSFFEISALPGAPAGNGSTALIGDVWITDATGATIIGRVNASMGPFMGPFQVSPPLAAGTYLVFVQHQGTTAGSNDFWVGKIFSSGTDNPREAETAPGANDTVATAETITMMPNGVASQGFILADLPADTDVDVFSVAVPAGDNVSVFCSSARDGSGVQGLQGRLLRMDGSQISASTEALDNGLVLQNIAVGGAPTVYLSLSKTSQDAVVTGTWVRCGVVAFPPG